LENGRIEIDNNLVENAIRPTPIGKKNWLFMGDAGTGDRTPSLEHCAPVCVNVLLPHNYTSYL
jgi:hypothetical protein